MQDLPPLDQYDAKDPPPSIIVVSLGTDTTDLVVTNGYRVWQRNIPLGGNHFTKALTKELKLTFTKAEHLKRNALKAEDPKAVFLAMRPVFNDLVTEVQRSISFFQSVDRTAKIGRVDHARQRHEAARAAKISGPKPGLRGDRSGGISRPERRGGGRSAGVPGKPAVVRRLLRPVLARARSGSQLRTNLIPREILQDRLIRAKKPWAVGAVAAVLLGFSVGFVGYWRALQLGRRQRRQRRRSAVEDGVGARQ